MDLCRSGTASIECETKRCAYVSIGYLIVRHFDIEPRACQTIGLDKECASSGGYLLNSLWKHWASYVQDVNTVYFDM